jgi:hypothetical protein
VFSLCCVFSALAREASAHAPPLATALIRDADGAVPIVVTNRGLVLRDVENGALSLLCNEALDTSSSEPPQVAWLGADTALAASSRGVRQISDGGCTVTADEKLGASPSSALATSPNSLGVLFLVTYDSAGVVIWKSVDYSQSWRVTHQARDDDYIHTISVASSSAPSPEQVYATGTTYSPTQERQHFLLRSHGDEWDRLALALSDEDYAARVLASTVDPSPLVVLGTVALDPTQTASRLLLSRDGGVTFSSVLAAPNITAAALDSHAQTLWVAAEDGLYRSVSDDLTVLERTSPASRLGCVSLHGTTLLTCGHFAGLSSPLAGVGASPTGGDTFQPWLDFAKVTSPVRCADSSPVALTCRQPWQDWSREILGAADTTNLPEANATPPMLPLAPITPVAAPTPPPSPPEANANGCQFSQGNAGRQGRWGGAFALFLLFAQLLRKRAPHS